MYTDIPTICFFFLLDNQSTFWVDSEYHLEDCQDLFTIEHSNASSTMTIEDLDNDISGYDVLIVEDILDSGLTLSYLTNVLRQRKVNSIKIATLLDKPERRQVDIKPDYACFVVPDKFVVGYGLDYDQKYRNLPYIGVVKPEVYTK